METRQNTCLTEGNKRTNMNKSELQELHNTPNHLSITLVSSIIPPTSTIIVTWNEFPSIST